jgi:hypothetical protein
MAGQDNLHIAREIFAAWNAHDIEAFVKRLDTKTRGNRTPFLRRSQDTKGRGSSSRSM